MLEQPYNKDLFEEFLKGFLPDFVKDDRPVRTQENSILTEVRQLGISKDTNLAILEAQCEETDSKKRIAITQAAFKVLRDHGIRNAVIAFHDGADQWRLSLLTSTLELIEGKVIKKDSNPRRYSYLLGVGAKTRTPHKYLIEKGRVSDIKSLQERFSVEVVNKQFYESIAELFTKLVGGERGRTRHAGLLKINDQINQNSEHQEFAVRLIGRIIFSWFLKEKKSTAGVPIIPEELLSLSAVTAHRDFYHSILEPLFFELLNKRAGNRHEALRRMPFSTVPYLNGGLFSPQYDDYYQQNSLTGGGNTDIVSIPDNWFTELFTVLEQYNFTVDENTSYDVDLSIDPEMLGRIFENLLAEINPETGESARKSTGSFYTPREIVDYMVDNSLREYLKSKTGIDEKKLQAIISWGQEDDTEHPLSDVDKKKIVDTLATLTILDPACGSGAFPIGLLQKVVYVLQQADEKAEIWLENQLKYVNSPELRRDIEEKYKNENYDWLRKLGVIRESIFGVDIQAVATEIAKLRCFLTLIIEEEVDDTKENRGIRPLPNLDFKFVTANSLKGLPDSFTQAQAPSMNLFEDSSHIEQLKSIRNQYFSADANERSRLQVGFKDLQLSMFRSRVASGGATSDLYNVLSDWNPFSHEKTEWFDSEWMFGLDGFDIVIANPPYVGFGSRGANKVTSNEIETIKKAFPNSAEYKINLYPLFMELAIRLSNSGGIQCYIVPDSFLLGKYFSKIRKYILKSANILSLVLFNGSVFGAVVGFSVVYVMRKGSEEQNSVFIKAGHNKNGSIDVSVTNEYSQSYFMKQDRNKFRIFFDYNTKALVEKIELSQYKLSDFVTFQSGLIAKAGQKAIVSEKMEDINWKPGLPSGKYVHRYAIEDAETFLHYKKELIKSGFGNVDYFSDKLFMRQTGDSIICALDKRGYLALNNVHIGAFIENVNDILKDCILAILNSRLIDYYYKNIAMEEGRVMAQIDIDTVDSIPMPNFELYSAETLKGISELVEEVTSLKNGNVKMDISEKKKEIDSLVYDLYNLTKEEIAIIENT